MDPQLLTIPQAAARLAVSRAMVYRLIGAGHLRPVKIGAAARIRVDDLAAYIAACQAAPDPDASGPRAGLGWAA